MKANIISLCLSARRRNKYFIKISLGYRLELYLPQLRPPTNMQRHVDEIMTNFYLKLHEKLSITRPVNENNSQ